MPPRKTSRNVTMLGVVADGLSGLREKVVFVGGATIDLFITDPAAPGARETDDVDCVVKLVGRVQYHVLEERLRALGFQQPLDEEAPICRWRFRGVKVDVMPVEGAILGFKSRWHAEGLAHAQTAVLPDGRSVYLGSKDLEDVVALLDGCPDAERRVSAAPETVRRYLAGEFTRLLADDTFAVCLEGHLRPGSEGIARVERCLALMRRLAA